MAWRPCLRPGARLALTRGAEPSNVACMSSFLAGALGRPAALARGRPHRLAFGLLCLAALPALTVTGLAIAVPAMAAVGFATLGAAVVGVRLYRPPAPGIWYLLGLSIGLLSLGMLLRPGVLLATPAVAGGMAIDQACYLLAYGALVAACAWAGARVVRPEPAAALEMAILAIALFAALWTWIYQPQMTAGAPWSMVLYPVFDSTLAVLAIHLVLSHRRVSRALWALLAAVVGALAVATYAAVVRLHGADPSPSWINGGLWLMAGSIGLAALHPSMTELAEPDTESGPHLSLVRLVVLGAAITLRGGLPSGPCGSATPSICRTSSCPGSCSPSWCSSA